MLYAVVTRDWLIGIIAMLTADMIFSNLQGKNIIDVLITRLTHS